MLETILTVIATIVVVAILGFFYGYITSRRNKK